MFGQKGVSADQLAGDAVHGGVQAEAGFHRGDQQVEQIGKALAVLTLPGGDAALDDLIRAHDGRGGEQPGNDGRAEASPMAGGPRQGEQRGAGRQDHGGHPRAQIERNGLAAEEAGLHQPRPQMGQTGRILDGDAVSDVPHAVDDSRQHRRGLRRLSRPRLRRQPSAPPGLDAGFPDQYETHPAEAGGDQQHGRHRQDGLELGGLHPP